jgi:lipopolysaccharide transport system ATP-binding protein
MQTNEVVISVESLSKSYLIGHENGTRGRQESLRDAIGRHAENFARAAIDIARGRPIVHGREVEEFWALKDISFDVRRGEVMGIIGRNGAGKSTLLKVLSRITEPTEGRAKIRGRVASLLEVGTGFHPDLTGRENIFLNGSILGMSRSEIKAKFNEIVDFADVEKFLDTPVKRYSSGMYVRLAFAVAAHLEPDILIIDEILAVGDLVFQKKCLGKIHDVAQSGRTVIFVSHNIPAIIGLTHRAALLEKGRLAMAGPTSEVVSHFLQSTRTEAQISGDLSAYRRPRRTADYVDICSIKVCGSDAGVPSIAFGDNVDIDIGLHAFRPLERAVIVINVLNESMEVLTSIVSTDSGFDLSVGRGLHTIRCDVGVLPIVPGYYLLSVGVAQSRAVLAWDVLESLPGFRIECKQDAGWLQSSDRPGVLLLDKCRWGQRTTSHALSYGIDGATLSNVN